MSSCSATVRPATGADIPALLSLLLTSFRQFQLFAFLYSPLNTNKDFAHDTIFFWRRRLLRELLDPSSSLIVAEVDECLAPTIEKPEELSGGGVEDESWRMWEWVAEKGRLSQVSKVTRGKVVVGWALWKNRAGEKAGNVVTGEERKSWLASLRTALLDSEIWFWNKVYQRKDQDLDAYAAYLTAEDWLSEKFYAESCYYLDNLCVDFRYQRLGIGTILAGWGLKNARRKQLPAQTEAGPMGVGLYLKLGFEKIGTWKVPTANGQQEFMEFPVMKLLSTLVEENGI